jgi:hypothetical protein
MRRVTDAVRIALVVFAVAVIAGLALALVRGLAAWRALRRFRGTTERRLEETAVALARLEARSNAVTAKVMQIERAQASLQRSLATARVVSDAAGEAWSFVERARAAMPRK